MELILVAAAAFVVGVSALAMHISVSNQSSKSSVSETLDDIEKSKEELDKKIKTQLLLGTVTIIAKIANWQAGREKARKEKINEIASASGAASAAITAAGMNIAQNVIQGIAEGANDITSADTSVDIHIETFPKAEQERAKIYDTPIIEQKKTEPLVFPKTEQEPKIFSFPHEEQEKQKLDPFPEERPKELGDNILEAKIIPKTGTWVPVGKTEAEWKAEHGYTTGANTLKTGENEHKKSCPLKDSNGNIIGRVDRGYRVNGNVVVDHVHLNTDVGNVHHWFNDKPKKNKNKKK